MNLIRYLRHDVSGGVGLGLVVCITVIALVTPLLGLPDPSALSNDIFVPPSVGHLLGTDNLGRDLLSQICWGARVSVLFGLVVASGAALLGVVMGTVPGYCGGLIDDVFSRIFELFLAVPGLFIIIVVVSLFGSNILLTMAVVAATVWPATAKIMRAQVLSLKRRDFVTASMAVGASHVWILRRHVVPNGLQPVVANSTLLIGTAIVLEAGLSFLGLGDPNLVSWGKMLQASQTYYFNAWWMAVFPGVAIFLTVLGFNLAGDLVNQALSPRMRTRRMALSAAPKPERGTTGTPTVGVRAEVAGSKRA
jgi:peptide/nickel transport system permease protein